MDLTRDHRSVIESRLCRAWRARFAAVICLVMLVGACHSDPRAAPKPVGTASADPATWLAKSGPRVIRIPDRAGDVLDHTGRAAHGQGAVDLVDVMITADASRLTIVLTCNGNIPKSSRPGAYDGKHDSFAWGADFWFSENLVDERRYFSLGARLVGTKWQGEITILVGSTMGLFNLNVVPTFRRNEVIISVPWSGPVTATKVQGHVVGFPRLPKRVFVSTGTQWDYLRPPGDLTYSAGGDKAPDRDKRVELSF